MSLPSAARLPDDDTVPAGPRTLVCPICRKDWPEAEAPALCPADGSRPVAPKHLVDPGDDPMVGRTLEGRYTILARLGAGSMGTVYRAKQHAMGREVAIKILRSERAADESAKARFLREAQANSLLASPNTVTVFDFGQSESKEFYLAMELLEGESLGQRLARIGRFAPAVAVDAARQALRSLGEAHAKGIIHRDLKPDNLFFARVVTRPSLSSRSSDYSEHDEIVKVLDFGIAKMINPDDAHPMGVVETQAGTVFGTPRYMSPEQAQGKQLDARSDLYSLGVILYQMLTGRPPFTDNDAVVVMARHIKSMPKRPNEAVPEAGIPRELEDVLMRVLAKDPDDRPSTAEIFAGELLAALEAQGATASGVRASVTNAAGIRIPDSLRPPPIPLPRPKRPKGIVLALALAGVLVLTAIAVAGWIRRDAPTAAAPTETSGVTTTPTAVTVTTSTPSINEPPTITPDSLPLAGNPQAPSKTTRVQQAAKPARSAATAGSRRPETGSAPTPPASATSSYGIFE